MYYEDTDCGGIVYHTNYMKYCERARSELFFSRGMLPSRETCGFVVSAMEARFLGFARLGDMLEVHTQVLKVGRVQLTLRQQVYVLPTVSPTVLYMQEQPTSPLESSGESMASLSAQCAQSRCGIGGWGALRARKGDGRQEACVFDARVRMGYVNVITQQPTQIPEAFIELFACLEGS